MGSFSWANGNSAEQRAFGDKREGCRTYSVMSLTKHQEMELDREENGRPLMRARTPLPSKLDEKYRIHKLSKADFKFMGREIMKFPFNE